MRVRLRTAVVTGTVLLIATLMFAQSFNLHRSWTFAQASAENEVELTARTAEAIVNRHLLQVDGALASVPALFGALARQSAEPVTAATAHQLLQGVNFQTFAFRDILLVHPSGTIWASARNRSVNRTAPFTPEVLRANTTPGASAVIGPRRNPHTGDWTLYVIRAVRVPGVGDVYAVADLPISLLQASLAPVSEQPGLRMVLARPSGGLLAAIPHDDVRLSLGSPVSLVAQAADGRPFRVRDDQGHDVAVAVVRPTLYADVMVGVEQDLATALGPWMRERTRLIIAVTVVSCLVIGFAVVVLVGIRREERLQRERAQMQRRLEDAIESMSGGFVMWDEDDRLIMCNQAYKALYEKSAPYIVPGATFEEIIRGGVANGQYPQAGDDKETFIKDLVAWHRAGQGSFERLLPDGTWLLVTERRTPSGGVVGIRTDITELKRQQEMIARYSEELEQFARVASHDLQEPLRKIATHTRLLLQAVGEQNAAEMQRCGQVLIASALRGRELVSDLLRYARLKGQAVTRSEVDLAGVIRDVADHLDDQGGGPPPVVDVRLASLRVHCDPSLLRQVFQNLLGNAAKYRKKDEPAHIVVSTEPDPDKPVLWVHVADQGIGFDMMHETAIFEPFRRLVTRRDYEGNGIGLSLVKSILDKHEWSVVARSHPGEGATFSIGIPTKDLAAPAAAVRAA